MDEGVDIRVRLLGGREAEAQAHGVARGVRGIGTSAERATKQGGLLGRTTSTLLKPFRHLREEAFGAAKGIAAAGLAFGSVEGIKRSIETTDSLVKTTVRLRSQFGLTTHSASGLAAVLQARDLQPQGLQMGLVALSRQLVAASHGSKNAQGAFRHFGISAHEARDALHSKDGLAGTFETVVDGLTKMHGGATKAALGQQLLGRASRGLAPLLQEGALGLKQQLKWAQEYGVTLDGKTVGSVEDMAAAQTQAQYAMLGLQIQLGRFAAPIVTKANIALADIVKSFRDGRPEGAKFARTVYRIGTDLKPLGHDLIVVARYLKDHPHLLQGAAIAYIGYRTKVLKLLSFAPLAFAKGYITGRGYAAGFEAGAAPGVIAAEAEGAVGAGAAGAAGRGALLRLLTGTAGRALLGVGIAHEIAKHILHSHNADPLDVLNPESAGLTPRAERAHLRAMHHPRFDAAAYYARHPGELDRASLEAFGRRVSYGPDVGNHHHHIYIDGREVAHVMVDRHGKVIAQGVAKTAQDAAARRHR
jgi:hypothetical protein